MKQRIGWKDLKSYSYGNLKRGGYSERKGAEEKEDGEEGEKGQWQQKCLKTALTKPVFMLI